VSLWLLHLAACTPVAELRIQDTALTDSATGTADSDSGTAGLDSAADTATWTDSATDTATVDPDDRDGDGHEANVDCDDEDPEIHPLAYDDCDGVDDDCNGVLDDATDCPCPINWHEDHAYLFCEDRRSWTDAREVCAGVGYHLLTVDSEPENEWVHELSDVLSTSPWWTGLNDRDSEGDFVWEDGTALDYTNWHDGEPNDWFDEDCMVLKTFHPARDWNDDACESSHRFICEVGP